MIQEINRSVPRYFFLLEVFMKRESAQQIADLLNSRNQLVNEYDAEKILKLSKEFIFINENEVVIACIQIKKVQWYQYEVLHLTVAPNFERRGIGTRMVTEAEEKARVAGARILQCTIRQGNLASEATFTKNRFHKVAEFYNEKSSNMVGVWQKVICSLPNQNLSS
jgi:N-acetylglutamate synthase-like GNAT family acetyltransferase